MTMSSYKHLSWKQFDIAVAHLKNKYKNQKYDGIYGPARGGLVLAVKLSHLLDIPLILKPRSGCLWVDDIIDSGATFNSYKGFMCKDYCCWVAREESKNYYNVLKSNKWIVFPWESSHVNDIQSDKIKYENKIC